jgi:hypothetical protein
MIVKQRPLKDTYTCNVGPNHLILFYIYIDTGVRFDLYKFKSYTHNGDR